MNKELLNYISKRSAQLKVLEDTAIWDSKVLDDSWESYIELLTKIHSSTNKEARKFWTEHLDIIKTALRRQDKINHEWTKLKIAYEELYTNYSEIVNINLELQKKITIFEEEFNK